MKLTQLRRGRGITSRKKRASLRKKQPRFAGKSLRSAFKKAPRHGQLTQAYLGSGARLEDLLA